MACSGDKKQSCGAGNRLSVISSTNAPTFGMPLSYGAWTAYGCMADVTSARTLPNSVSLANYGGSSNATIENALNACADKGYTWCGQEYYSEAYGSKAAPNASLVVASASQGVYAMVGAGCSYKCNGNSAEACGGSNRIIVYQYNA